MRLTNFLVKLLPLVFCFTLLSFSQLISNRWRSITAIVVPFSGQVNCEKNVSFNEWSRCCKVGFTLITHGHLGQIHQSFMHSFYAHRSQTRKKDSQVISVFLYFWDLCAWMLLKKCYEIKTRCRDWLRRRSATNSDFYFYLN